MLRVIIESPFQGTGPWPIRVFRQWANVRYARRCMLDSLQRGEAPFLSHLLYPQVLNEDKPGDREIGIRRGLDWAEVASMTVVYTDRGITIGMKIGIKAAEMNDIPIVYRSLKAMPWWCRIWIRICAWFKSLKEGSKWRDLFASDVLL